MVVIVLQWITLPYLIFLTMILVTNGIASYLFAVAVIKDVKCALKEIDKCSETKKGRKRIYKQFTEFIDLHSAIEQLSLLTA